MSLLSTCKVPLRFLSFLVTLICCVAENGVLADPLATEGGAADSLAEYLPEPIAGAGSIVVATGNSASQWSSEIDIEVTDMENHPISNASLVLNGTEYLTNDQGYLRLMPSSVTAPLLVKVPGYQKQIIQPVRGPLRIKLETFEAKAVYVSSLINQSVMRNVMNLLQTTELNALVIDVKGDSGRVLNGNMKEGLTELRNKGVYTIARIVTFKDNIAPKKFPDLALRSLSSGLWLDESKSAFLDPRNPKAWEYVIAIAEKAALAGFDEIQFDYVRFPTGRNRQLIAGFSGSTAASRSAAIAGFLKLARERLGRLGAFVAADLFGIAAHESGDVSKIGQIPEVVSQYLDYVCPMVYPSGYASGTDGIGNPVTHPGQIVGASVKRFRVRVVDGKVIRPWLQSFKDYPRRGGAYGAEEIRAQIDASEKSGGQGFMLWNAANNYSKAGLKEKLKRLFLSHAEIK